MLVKLDHFPRTCLVSHPRNTPLKFNSEFTPEKLPGPNGKGLSSNHHFSGAVLNFGGVCCLFFEMMFAQPEPEIGFATSKILTKKCPDLSSNLRQGTLHHDSDEAIASATNTRPSFASASFGEKNGCIICPHLAVTPTPNHVSFTPNFRGVFVADV